MQDKVIDNVLTDHNDLLAISVLGPSHHVQELQHYLTLCLSRRTLVEIVFQELPDKMKIEGSSQFEDPHE